MACTRLMSTSLKVVSMAVFCRAVRSRSAIRWRMRLMGLRVIGFSNRLRRFRHHRSSGSFAGWHRLLGGRRRGDLFLGCESRLLQVKEHVPPGHAPAGAGGLDLREVNPFFLSQTQGRGHDVQPGGSGSRWTCSVAVSMLFSGCCKALAEGWAACASGFAAAAIPAVAPGGGFASALSEALSDSMVATTGADRHRGPLGNQYLQNPVRFGNHFQGHLVGFNEEQDFSLADEIAITPVPLGQQRFLYRLSNLGNFDFCLHACSRSVPVCQPSLLVGKRLSPQSSQRTRRKLGGECWVAATPGVWLRCLRSGENPSNPIELLNTRSRSPRQQSPPVRSCERCGSRLPDWRQAFGQGNAFPCQWPPARRP